MSRGPILVTGFGAFPGAPLNPTEALVAALAQRPGFGPTRLEPRLLPVSWRQTANALRAAIADTRPRAVLMFGLDRRCRKVKVELRAVNQATREAPDAEGMRHPTGLLDADGPRLRRSRLDRTRMMTAIASTGAGVRLSRNAGAYLCNAALWTALEATEESVPVAFIHVPPPSRLDAERLLAVAAALIEALAEGLDQSPPTQTYLTSR
jgi:pyroglutamyl-peptidase